MKAFWLIPIFAVIMFLSPLPLIILGVIETPGRKYFDREVFLLMLALSIWGILTGTAIASLRTFLF